MENKKYEEFVKELLHHLGGEENIVDVTHCITRLRFSLLDKNKVDLEAVEKMDGVISVVTRMNQFHVVVGSHVPEVFRVVQDFLQEEEKQDVIEVNPTGTIIDVISGVLAPLIGVMVCASAIKGINALLLFTGLIHVGEPIYQILLALGDGFFRYMPILVAFTASKKFRLNYFTGMTLIAVIMYLQEMISQMEFSGADILFSGTPFQSVVAMKLFGIPIIYPNGGYTSSAVSVIVIIYIASLIEQLVRKVIPDMVKVFFVPFFTLILCVPLTVIAIGPIVSSVILFIGVAVFFLFRFSPVIAGFLVGGIWQLLVVFGLHWGVIPISSSSMAIYGYDMIMPTTFLASFAQTAAVLAVIVRTKDQRLKLIGIPAAISGIMGITEAAIYGVTLPKKRPFVITCIVAAFAGGVVGLFDLKAYSPVGFGVFGYTSYLREGANGASTMVWMMLLSVLVMIVSFLLTFITYQESDEFFFHTRKSKLRINRSMGLKEVIYSPVKGELISLKEVSDPAFSSLAVGDGVAVIPSGDVIYAPFSGTVETLFSTKHAIGIRSKNGVVVLIHVGIDTVRLEGRHFHVFVQKGEYVTKGQKLIEFDRKAIEEEGYSLVTPIVIPNYYEFQEIVYQVDKKIKPGKEMIAIL